MYSEYNMSTFLEDWIISHENGSAMLMNLTDLWPNSYYQLEVTAHNDLGWSEPHEVFIFKTAPTELSTMNASSTSEHPETFQLISVCLQLFHASKYYHICLLLYSL